MDGLGVQCDSANLRLLPRVCRNKIERKFLVPHGAKKGEKSTIRCGIARCHLVCQVCLPVLLKFDSLPLNERSDIAGLLPTFLILFLYHHFSYTIIVTTSCKPFRFALSYSEFHFLVTLIRRIRVVLNIDQRTFSFILHVFLFISRSCIDHADDVNLIKRNRHGLVAASKLLYTWSRLLFVMQSGIKTNG